jgi:hypothetical protein
MTEKTKPNPIRFAVSLVTRNWALKLLSLVLALLIYNTLKQQDARQPPAHERKLFHY